MAVLTVSQLTKSYFVPVRNAGIRAALRSIVRRETKEVQALRDVSFTINAGEMVAFLGANGAGKTTTLKTLTGLLHPTSGDARVLGYQPWRRQREYLQQITLVMGQRNQLLWDIPVIDSFERNRAIYEIARRVYAARLDELIALLDLEVLLNKPVRNLSLGERMRCEMAAALLHAPRVLFLDEPTIGLDVTMQRRLRRFISEYNQRSGATVLLTSHYMADVQALCKRVIVIHHGRLIFDGTLHELVERFATHKTVSVRTSGSSFDPDSLGKAVSYADDRVAFSVPKDDTRDFVSSLLTRPDVADLTVEDPPLEDVIHRVFSKLST